MTEYATIFATESDALDLAGRMKQADRKEIWASHRHSPAEALIKGIRTSKESWAWTVDDKVVCMFGVATKSFLSDTGVPWLLGDAETENHVRPFLRMNKQFIKRWKGMFSKLENHVDSRHEKSIRWLSWMGFEIHEPEKLGPDGVLFHRFTMKGSL